MATQLYRWLGRPDCIAAGTGMTARELHRLLLCQWPVVKALGVPPVEVSVLACRIVLGMGGRFVLFGDHDILPHHADILTFRRDQITDS